MNSLITDPWLSGAETAAMLGMTYESFRQLRAREEGPPAYKIGARLKWRRSDVDAWLRTRKVAAGASA